jgi:hypothetical protein
MIFYKWLKRGFGVVMMLPINNENKVHYFAFYKENDDVNINRYWTDNPDDQLSDFKPTSKNKRQMIELLFTLA